MDEHGEATDGIQRSSSTDVPPPPYNVAGPMARARAGSMAQPKGGAMPTYAVVVPAGLPRHMHHHTFLALSIIVALFCGFFNILVLICSIPAIAMSTLSSQASRSGRYSQGKTYGNVSAGLSVGGLLCGMLTIYIAGLIIALIFLQLAYCGLSGPCNMNFAG